MSTTEVLELGASIVPTNRADHAVALSQAISMVRRFDGMAGRSDGWSSSVTGIGTRARDKAFDATFGPATFLSDPELENLCDGNGMAARICEIPGDRAMQKGLTVAITPDDDDDRARATEVSTAVTKQLEKLGIVALVGEACFWRRGLGGGAIYIDADDGQPTDKPLLEQRIRSVRCLRYYSKRELTPASWYADSRHPKFGQAATYYLTPMDAGVAAMFTTVHESRLAIFDGMRVSKTRRRQNQGWGGSILVRIYETLRNYGLGWAATTQLMQVSSQAVYTMRGLVDGVADGHKAAIEERMALVELYRSIARAILLDAGDLEGKGAERFELQSVDWGGLAPVLDLYAQVVCAETGYPMTVLFGRSPAGMNASGESDQQTMDAIVETEQSQVIEPAVTYISRVCMLAKDSPTRGLVPKSFTVGFPPLRVLSAEKQAAIRKTQAETDAIEIDRQMITPEEATLSRHREEGWSGETTINREARVALLEAEHETDEAMRAEGAGAEEATTGAPGAKPADPNAPPVPEEAKDPSTALNGAQTSALEAILVSIAERRYPRESGVGLILAAYPLTEPQVERLVGDVGRTFFVDKPEPPPAFGAGAPAKPPPAQEPPQGTKPGDDEDEDEDVEPAAGAAGAAAGVAARPKRVGARARADAHRVGASSAWGNHDNASTSDVIRLDADEPRGAMVALFLDPTTAARFARTGGTPPEDMHVTLAYLGYADAIHPASLAALRNLLAPIAAACTGPMQAWLSGVGTFAPTGSSDGEPVSYLSVDAPWLPRLREAVIDACRATPMVAPSEAHGFTPHITLAYGGHVLDRVPFDAPVPVMFGELVLCVGAERERFAFGGSADAALTPAQSETVTRVLAKIISGELPRETGVELIEASTRMPRTQVETLVGDIGRPLVPSRKQGE